MLHLSSTHTHLRLSPLSETPSIANKPSNPNITLPIGGTHTITANVTGTNSPTNAVWRKDGQFVSNQSVSGNEVTLPLTNSNHEVRGRYELTVSNTGGSDSFVYNVKVECKYHTQYM